MGKAIDSERLLVLKTRHANAGPGDERYAVLEKGEFYEILALANRGLASAGLVEALETIVLAGDLEGQPVGALFEDSVREAAGALARFEAEKAKLEVPSLDNQEPAFYEDPGNF